MAVPSVRPGIGAAAFPGGVTFRVWAPFAPWVRVAGSFNQWSATANDLASEGNGYWSADIAKAAVGDHYRFVVGSMTRWRADPRARAVTRSDGDAVVAADNYRWRVNDFTMPPWNELVIYELHLGSFLGRRATLASMLTVASRGMGHLQNLGVNAIEIMPAQEFPGDDSWGYNPTHLFAVETAYGGPDALKQFVDDAHAHGIAVILDVVYNHLGPNDLIHSVWQFDGWWEGDDMGGVYFYNDWRAWTPWGHKNRPDYGRPEVRQFLHDNVLMWLEEYRIDGLRFDMTVYIRNVYGADGVPPEDPTNLGGWGWSLLRWINDEVDARQPWKVMIAEDMRQNAAVTAPTSQGGAGFDGQWDDQFHHTLRRAIVVPGDEERDVWSIKSSIDRRYSPDAFRRVIYTESHDEVGEIIPNPLGKQRVPEHIQPGQADGWYAQKRSTLGAAVVFTSPGIPMIFQGQEMLEWIQFTGKGSMDWDKLRRFPGIVRLYRDLIRLRRNWFNNTRGLRGHHTNVYHVNPQDKVLAVHRWQEGGPGDDVIAVLNFGNRTYAGYSVGFPHPGAWRVRFNSDWSGYSPAFHNHASNDTVAHGGRLHDMPCHGDVGIGCYTAIILSQ
ncbi:MAG: alpha amylase C-terminal domain-containing protein [Planctomycetes bacterium]|nr:alpha amylase C-terminal domain-containing protein [Planctomycetota bacterium]